MAVLVGLALSSAASAATEVRQYRFRVFLDNIAVGYHRVRVQLQGDEAKVDVDARVDVKLLSVPVFRYQHRATERWHSGCLRSLVATTDDNGKHREVAARSDGEQVSVLSARGEESLQGCVMSYAYWNPAMMRGTHLLNAQTGEYQAVKVTTLPEETITVRGASLPARRYRVDTGRHEIDVWYSRDGQWLGLESVVALGRHLRYRPE